MPYSVLFNGTAFKFKPLTVHMKFKGTPKLSILQCICCARTFRGFFLPSQISNNVTVGPALQDHPFCGFEVVSHWMQCDIGLQFSPKILLKSALNRES